MLIFLPPSFKFSCMMRPVIALYLFFQLWGMDLRAQSGIIPGNIDIVRDSFGVPHIFARTDGEVAYGLAYAHAEDDFSTLQQGFMAGKGLLGRYKGKSGAAIDYVVRLIRARELVDQRYGTDISPAYRQVLEGYCAGFNAFARSHPREVLVPELFPLTPKDMLTYSVLQLFASCGGDLALQKILSGQVPRLDFLKYPGSNGYAFNSHKTTDGKVYLNINSHQPLDGPVAWYEAHLHSDEGWNIIGGLFPGSPNILVGCNEYLGWAHTVNNPDKLDIYQLDINPANPLQYRMDGHWENLEVSVARLRVKIAGIRISVKRKVYWCRYGPALVTGQGVFAIRTGSLFRIDGLEQWYWMNKARNFSEFHTALERQAIPGYNVIYADRYDTIYYLSNGLLPFRDPHYDWEQTLPGNTVKTLWERYHPLGDLPQLLNPSSGYLYNSNHSPFNASAPRDNLNPVNFDPTMGYETNENNRSIRFRERLAAYPKINYEQFKSIKYDRQLPGHLAYRINGDSLFLLRSGDYPKLAPLITELQAWDRKAETGSRGAALFGIIYYYVVDRATKDWKGILRLNTGQCLEAIAFARDYQMKYFGKTGVDLGEYQKLVRGKKVLGLPGLPDVIAAMESEPFKKGMVRGRQGDSYIELVKFSSEGPEIESINCYGASNHPGNPHFDDQMELYIAQKTKNMYLEKSQVYARAEKIYHPQ
jgi:acyl-homoserine-lactone acylase